MKVSAGPSIETGTSDSSVRAQPTVLCSPALRRPIFTEFINGIGCPYEKNSFPKKNIAEVFEYKTAYYARNSFIKRSAVALQTIHSCINPYIKSSNIEILTKFGTLNIAIIQSRTCCC